MKFNIPCRSNPMPYYTNPPAYPDYEQMPLTFEPISSNTSIALTNNGSSNKTFYYKTNSMSDWAQYTFGTTINLNYSENGSDTCSFSGDSNPFNYQTGETNPFKFFGSSGGQLKAYGNVHSLINYATLNNYGFRNLFRAQSYISDYTGIFLPMPSGYSVQGLYGSAWREDNYVKKLPILRATNWNQVQGNAFDAAGYSAPNISMVEVSWITWPTNYSTLTYFLNGVSSSPSCIYIKPTDLQLLRSSGDGKIPNGWTVLNRDTDPSSPTYGKLTYAETANGHTAGEEYTDEDPYIWYYKR